MNFLIPRELRKEKILTPEVRVLLKNLEKKTKFRQFLTELLRKYSI